MRSSLATRHQLKADGEDTLNVFQRLLHRKPSHEEWLDAHPGKRAPKTAPAAVDEAEQQRTSDQMEGELDQQRARRAQE